MKLEEMKSIDIRTIDPKTLVDRRNIKVDKQLPRDQRLKQYIEQIKNPYCYLDGDVVVKVSFNTFNEEGVPSPGKLRYLRGMTSDKRYASSLWSAPLIKQILKNPTYLGHLVFGRMPTALYLGKLNYQWKSIENEHTFMRDESEWIVVPNCHEAIASDEEFTEAQKAIRKTSKYERSDKKYLLRSLIRCGVCGRGMTRNARGKVTTYYCDKSRFVEDTNCPIGERFKESELEKVILDNFISFLNLLVDHEKQLKEAVTKTKGTEAYLKQEVLNLEKSIKQNSQAKVTSYERYSDGIISRSEFMAIREELSVELDSYTEKKVEVEKQFKDLANTIDPELKQLTEKAHDFLSAEQITNKMLLFFIDRIYVYSGMKIEIVYKFKDTLKEILEP